MANNHLNLSNPQLKALSINDIIEYMENDDTFLDYNDIDFDNVKEVNKLKVDISKLMMKFDLKFIGKSDFVIYRTISIKSVDEFFNELKPEYNNHLGVYWTFNKNFLRSIFSNYSRTNNADMVFKTSVNNLNIDWLETIVTNFIFPDEFELRVIENTPIKLENVWVINDVNNIQPSDLKKENELLPKYKKLLMGKTLYA